MAARPQRPQHIVARGLGPADQLDDDLRSLEDLVEVTVRTPQDPRNLGPATRRRLDRPSALGNEFVEGTADRPAAEQPDADRVGHSTSRATRSSHDSRRTTTLASPSLQKTTAGRGTPL